ncbi:MAG: mechanosensitive ion channel family protein [Firmicutes bacterium]|nr:mechanosensitive ion channel family protein [Bacillota bacterium]
MLYNFFMHEDFVWVIARFVVTLLITLIIAKTIRLRWGKFEKDTIHRKFTKNVLSVAVAFAGAILAFSWFPQFTDFAMALLAGSGFVALAIGLAAQESLSNAFNGLFISISKPFEVGDRIHLVNANITGFVEDITIRHTVIRTFVNSRIIIPNTIISKDLIENSNFVNPQASGFIDVIISYGNDVEKACQIVADVIGNHAEFVDTRTPEQQLTDPKVPVFVRMLGIYGIELRSNMWTEEISTNFRACSEVRKGILRDFAKHNIQISSVKIIDVLQNNPIKSDFSMDFQTNFQSKTDME